MKKNYSIYKFFKIMLAVLIIPAMLLSIFSSVVMISSKSNGGIPTLFGNSVVEMPHNRFEESEKLEVGQDVLFTKLDDKKYAVDNIIAYFSTKGDSDALVVETEWFNLGAAQTFASTYASEGVTEVSVGRIVTVGEATDLESGEKYVIFNVADRDGNNANLTTVFAQDVIGVAQAQGGLMLTILTTLTNTQTYLMIVGASVLVIALLILITYLTGKRLEDSSSNEKQKIIEEEVRKEKDTLTVEKDASYFDYAANLNTNKMGDAVPKRQGIPPKPPTPPRPPTPPKQD